MRCGYLGTVLKNPFWIRAEVGYSHRILYLILFGEGTRPFLKLTADSAAYLTKRTGGLDHIVRRNGGIEIGVHVHHGDRHPLEFR
jgi:hypothetical protein